MWITTLHLALQGLGYVDCRKANHGPPRTQSLIVFLVCSENGYHHI